MKVPKASVLGAGERCHPEMQDVERWGFLRQLLEKVEVRPSIHATQQLKFGDAFCNFCDSY